MIEELQRHHQSNATDDVKAQTAMSDRINEQLCVEDHFGIPRSAGHPPLQVAYEALCGLDDAGLMVVERSKLGDLLAVADHADALVREYDRVKADPDAEMDWTNSLITGPLRAALSRLDNR
jgi:hypothetical protein